MSKQYLFNQWIELSQANRVSDDCGQDQGYWILKDLVDDKALTDKTSYFDNFDTLESSSIATKYPLYVNESEIRRLEFLVYNPVGQLSQNLCADQNEFYTWKYPSDACPETLTITKEYASNILKNKVYISLGKK